MVVVVVIINLIEYYQLNCLDEWEISVLQYYIAVAWAMHIKRDIGKCLLPNSINTPKALCMHWGHFVLLDGVKRIVNAYIIMIKSLQPQLNNINTLVHTHVDKRDSRR